MLQALSVSCQCERFVWADEKHHCRSMSSCSRSDNQRRPVLLLHAQSRDYGYGGAKEFGVQVLYDFCVSQTCVVCVSLRQAVGIHQSCSKRLLVSGDNGRNGLPPGCSCGKDYEQCNELNIGHCQARKMTLRCAQNSSRCQVHCRGPVSSLAIRSFRCEGQLILIVTQTQQTGEMHDAEW